MPTVRLEGYTGPYRFFFYAGDRREPAHIHVERENKEAKFWLDPVELAFTRGFRGHEVNRIRSLIVEHEQELLRKWHDYFTTRS